MEYAIFNDELCYVSISSVELKSKGNWSCTIVKFRDLNTHEFACSLIYPSALYDALKKDMDGNTMHTFRKITIQTGHKYYKRVTWEDVARCKSWRNHLNEVMYYKSKPIIYEKLTLLINIDSYQRPSIEEIISREYIDVESPEAEKALLYNNFEHYKQKKYDEEIIKEELKNKEQEEFISSLSCGMDDDVVDRSDWAYEDQIMYDLENGNGEVHGF